MKKEHTLGIERNFDIPFVSALALREKQIQQNYRPIIAVHKWFARRPGTLFRALLLSEFGSGSLRERFFESNQLHGLRIADPFMGGGTPLLEANRLGCDVTGFDINPMAYWIVRQEMEWLDVSAYQAAAGKLMRTLQQKIGSCYETRCTICAELAPVKYFLWVKTIDCGQCHEAVDLFPGYVLAEKGRHPRNVLVCTACGALAEVDDLAKPRKCPSCRAALRTEGVAKGGRCRCQACGTENRYPASTLGPPKHRMFALEYHCAQCKRGHKGRFFKKPDADDLKRYSEAESAWQRTRPSFVPSEEIPAGDETNRLHRWGYRFYREMFNDRQLLGLETSARLIAKQPSERLRNALGTNLSDLLRYQNMLCRYDRAALKSLDIFSVHGFPVGLVQCESNLLGIALTAEPNGLFSDMNPSTSVNVGSGGWCNIVDKYAKAKSYCAHPFEVRYRGGRKAQVATPGEWIGDEHGIDSASARRVVDLRCQSATEAELAPASLDAVLTDPPYFGNVQYAELMDFCYVWLRRLINGSEPAFVGPTTRCPGELTGNATMDRGVDHFTEGIAETFTRMAKALKPGAPLAFTYHHNTPEAYLPIAVAILDSGLCCTAALPCPAEMAASIHINGTGSSVVDTIFVCRASVVNATASITPSPAAVAACVRQDLEALQEGGVRPTIGDTRCIIFGHLVRVATWHLRSFWNTKVPVDKRLAAVALWIDTLGGLAAVDAALGGKEPLPASLAARGARSGKVTVRTRDV